jgi:hypothetical protein
LLDPALLGSFRPSRAIAAAAFRLLTIQ